jgi:CubicO group peptidase (beta-lactamase class C family)
MLPTGKPEDLGMDGAGLDRAFELLRSWVDQGTLPGASALVARRGFVVGRRWFGDAALPPRRRPIGRDTLFAVASVTKPFTATAIMQLAERGALSIDQPVETLLPEFAGPGKEGITLRHFLSHTSGLPEYADDNEEIRARHLGLDAFVRSYCGGQPCFAPGSRWSYSNFGFGLAGEIIARRGGLGYHELVAAGILEPLRMSDSYLRPPESVWGRIAEVSLPTEPRSDHERYNSPYFRGLGIPWGGLYSTPDDLAVFAQAFLEGGAHGGRRILSPASVREMTRNQLAGDAEGVVPWRAASWGLGWDVKGRKAPHSSGALTSAATFGHTGSSGSMVWVDPELELVCVMIGTRSAESGWSDGAVPRRALFSNAVVAAVADAWIGRGLPRPDPPQQQADGLR